MRIHLSIKAARTNWLVPVTFVIFGLLFQARTIAVLKYFGAAILGVVQLLAKALRELAAYCTANFTEFFSAFTLHLGVLWLLVSLSYSVSEHKAAGNITKAKKTNALWWAIILALFSWYAVIAKGAIFVGVFCVLICAFFIALVTSIEYMTTVFSAENKEK